MNRVIAAQRRLTLLPLRVGGEMRHFAETIRGTERVLLAMRADEWPDSIGKS
jgi:hypothetical protein